MWPLSAVQLSPVARPCSRRSCPNGPRLDQREITRMMSLMAHSVIRGMSAIWSLSEAKRTLFGTGASWLGRE
jgi:hypothetical protein